MKSIRVAGHPAHLLIVHFPMALCGIVPVWDVIWLLSGVEVWWQVAYACLGAGLLAGAAAALTGFLDYLAIPDDAPAHRTATLHLLATGGGLLLFLASLLARGGMTPPGSPGVWVAITCSAIGATLFAAGGWLGGELVLLHGIGTRKET